MRSILLSLLLHSLLICVFLIGGGTGSPYAPSENALSVQLLNGGSVPRRESARPRSIIGGSEGENGGGLPVKSNRAARSVWDSTNQMSGEVEGYLPQAFLSRTAVPADDIDLQDISSPEEGTFQMYLWIDGRGSVTRVDVLDSNVAGWFIDQVVERFKGARFTPGVRGDRFVASIMLVEVFF